MIMPGPPEQAPPSPSTDDETKEKRGDEHEMEAEDTSSLTPNSNPATSVRDSRKTAATAGSAAVPPTKSKSNSLRVMLELGFEEEEEAGELFDGLSDRRNLASAAVSAGKLETRNLNV